MDEATMIGEHMGVTENIHAWAGEDLSWMQPTGQWQRSGWLRRLKAVVRHSLLPVEVGIAVALCIAGASQIDWNPGPPPVMNVAPTAPPVPHPMQTPPDPYYTEVSSPQEFLDSLKSFDVPVPDDAVKEAHDICRLLEGGMRFHQAMEWTHQNHPGWKLPQVGTFTGAATDFCPKYAPG